VPGEQVLILAATNLVGIVLFVAVYAAGGARYLSPAGFLAALALIFALVTALWLRTEARHQALEPLRRLGRAAAGLLVVLIGVPVLVLLPLFWLESVLPPEAGIDRVLAPTMTLLLIGLALVVLVNVLAALMLVSRGLARRARRVRR
jgi:hypothetical protein